MDGNAFDEVDDDEGAIGDAKRSADLAVEVDVAGRVDKVDEVGARGVFEDHRDARGRDGNALLLFERVCVERASHSNVFGT